jgi:hypothetical protein
MSFFFVEGNRRKKKRKKEGKNRVKNDKQKREEIYQ